MKRRAETEEGTEAGKRAQVQEPPTSHTLTPQHFGLQEQDVEALAQRLGVEKTDVLCETLSHVATCKLNRGEGCFRRRVHKKPGDILYVFTIYLPTYIYTYAQ